MSDLVEKLIALANDFKSRAMFNSESTALEAAATITRLTLERDGARAAMAKEAAECLDPYDEYNVKLCCDGSECGCQGTYVHEKIKDDILALANVPSGYLCIPKERADLITKAEEALRTYNTKATP